MKSNLNYNKQKNCKTKKDAKFKMKYCITGIFPGTFISRKMMFSTFSRFLISRPAHGCTDIIFTESVCFRF